MRVLIVGCGYVGLPLGAELARRGHSVFGMRRGKSAEGQLRAAGIEPLVADITLPQTLEGLPRDWDWVVECVSSSGGGVEDYRAVYLEGTRNLVKWLSPQPPRKFVYTGSTGVYAQNDGSVVTEESPATPEGGTAAMLRKTEQVLLRAAKERNFPAVVLRLAGIYGPERGYWLKQFETGQARLDQGGERILNMIHRDDVVGAVLAALERGKPGEIYNVVDDEPVSQRALFEWMAQRFNRPMPGPATEATPRRRAATSKRVSNEKIRRELGYEFKHPTFREGFGCD